MKKPYSKFLLALVALTSSWLFIESANSSPVVISSISTGTYHSCALTTMGGVKCWGSGQYGALGNNNDLSSTTPVDVVGLSSGVSAIAAGDYHTCALMIAGGVKCWGWNNYGELGDNTFSGSGIPVDVTSLSSGVIAITAGTGYTCALTAIGGVKCWGYNGLGQLGDNTTTQRNTPVDVVGLSGGVIAIAATSGGVHTCALTTFGSVKCWGDNLEGELGDNTTVNKSIPVDVVGLSSGVSAISVGDFHSCALMTAGGVKCWGDDGEGELGDNGSSGSKSLTPVDVAGLSSGITTITAGFGHTCALTTAGGVNCWGFNRWGELGDNTTVNESVPVEVVGLSSGVTAIAAGEFHTCALLGVGGVKCWGDNIEGELGNLSGMLQCNIPVDVVGFNKANSDFDGNHISDVLFINFTTGGIRYWESAFKGIVINPGAMNLAYTYNGAGDFDGDGTSDLFFTRASNNSTMIWSGAVKTAATYPGTGATGFSVAAICDTNGDGKDDIVWFNATTGKTQIWPAANEANVTYPGTQNTDFSVVACADFDGDGKADLFWHNATSGANEIWLSAKISTKLHPGINTDLTMIVVGAGDTDDDGKSDLVWYKPSNGAIQVWKGGLKSAWVYLGTKDTSFTPKAIGDYDGDGKADLLWSNDTTGITEIWPAFVKANAKYPGAVPSGFSIPSP